MTSLNKILGDATGYYWQINLIYKLLGLFSGSSKDPLFVVQIFLYLVSKKKKKKSLSLNIKSKKKEKKKRKEEKRVVELGANWIQASIVISQGSMCKACASHGKKK